MSSGGSSHPDPPPGFTVTSGANWTLDIQYAWGVQGGSGGMGSPGSGGFRGVAPPGQQGQHRASIDKMSGPFSWLG